MANIRSRDRNREPRGQNVASFSSRGQGLAGAGPAVPGGGKTKTLASKYIAEEMKTKKYPRKQAIAIGISRAKTDAKKKQSVTRLKRLLKTYK